MTWTAVRRHADKQLDDYALEMFRKRIPQRLEQFRNGSAAAADQLAFQLARMLFARGAVFVRHELEPIKHIVPQSLAAYLRGCAGDRTLASMVLEYANAANVFEIVGLDIAPEVLEAFRSVILRIETHRHDMPERHWTKGLLALALNQRLGWAPIARLMPTQDVPFVPRATFGFDVQGLIAHLGGARLVGATFDDVLPAWREFMAAADSLMGARQIDEQVILWVARIVFHHIGKQPLGAVGDCVYEEIGRFVEAE